MCNDKFKPVPGPDGLPNQLESTININNESARRISEITVVGPVNYIYDDNIVQRDLSLPL